MGSIPVARPSPLRPWRFSRRVIPLMFLGLAVVAVIGVAVAVAWPSGPQDSAFQGVVRTDNLTVNEPHPVGEDVYVVLLKSGEVLALSRTDPHLGCTVAFRPGHEFLGHTGWFFNPCHNETYDLTGVCYAGPCPRGLDRYQVRLNGGEVKVNFSRLIPGPPHDSDIDRDPTTPE